MTHDEILEYVDFLPLDGLLAWMQPALRAVVELHPPQEITLPDGSWGFNCVSCDGLTYPCLTIEVIEAVLND